MIKYNSNYFNILSLFSGGGLLDLGFLNQGFNIVEAVEIYSPFIKAYNYAIKSYLDSKPNTLINDIKFKQIEKSKDISQKVIQEELFNNYKGITGLIGGPPCQDFSVGGKNIGATGKRGKLINSYYKVVELLKPSFIFFENVEGLYKTKTHNKAFTDLVGKFEVIGYEIWFTTINALEYGIPQDRSRLVLVGLKNEIIQKLLIHGFKLEKDTEILKNQDNNNYVFRWPQAINKDPKKEEWPGRNKFKGCISKSIIDNLENRYPNLLVKNAFTGLNNSSPNQKEHFVPYSHRFKTIDEGDTNRKSFKRLHRYRFSPTVAYGNNEVHLHPTKARRLTVREALRLQSVPDNYILPSEITLTDKFKLIGNGVPCKLAESIAKEIKRTLTNYYSIKD